MDRVAVFVDAGYLFAQGSLLVAGKRLQRGEIMLDHEKVIGAFEEFAGTVSGLPLLRIYWYDGTSTGPSPQHIALSHVQGVKMRLGFVNSAGEQKGVDSLIVTDMINLARNRAMADAVLLSGDEDLRVGVQQAQEFGVRVHLLGVLPSRGNQSRFLMQEADTCHEWLRTDLEAFLSRKHLPMAPEVDLTRVTHAASMRETGLAAEARRAAFEILPTELKSLAESIRQSRQVPRDVDSKLLARGRTHVNRDLTMIEKKELRRLFLKACEARLSDFGGADDV